MKNMYIQVPSNVASSINLDGHDHEFDKLFLMASKTYIRS